MENLLALQPVAKELAQSRLHGHRNPADVLFVLSVGQALGLNAATALMNIYNVNGMPSLKADLKLALAKQHPEYAGCEIDSKPDKCTVTMYRNNGREKESITITFTLDDAKTANLTGKDNWKKYPARMLKARAVSYAVNDLFPDIVFGLMSKEEADDLVESKAAVIIDTIPVETEINEVPVIEEIPVDIIEIKKAICGMLTKMVESNIDGFADETRRKNSFIKHLNSATVSDCQDLNALIQYHDHLAAKMRTDAKPTIKQRQDKLIEKLNSMEITLEELQHWSEKVQTATRNAALDEVQEWINKAEVTNV
jgi:hypothetical protein